MGKTTLALQFLMEGVRLGERVLYITLSETREELAMVAESHGWTLDGIDLYELSAMEDLLDGESENTVFHPSEVELTETTKALIGIVEQVQPSRAVFDSLSEMRLLARDALRYRRQILALKQYFTGKRCTVLLLDDQTSEPGDLQLQSIAHGVLLLEQLPTSFGVDRRRFRVQKLRGVSFRSGYHDLGMLTGGMRIYPRLIAAEHRQSVGNHSVSSGVAALDELLGGGLDEGVSTLLLGPAGAGKSTIAIRYAVAAAERGDRAALYSFEETPRTLYKRCRGLGIDLEKYVRSGHVIVQHIDPAELTPGEFIHQVREDVRSGEVKIVAIDSLNGYLNAMPEERFLILQLHELLSFLGQQGISTILVVAQHGMLGANMASPVDVSYLADTVILFRLYEFEGHLKQAISVVKRRGGQHDRSIRELRLGENGGIGIGPPLESLHGVFTGVPRESTIDVSRTSP
ncbi:putative circadian clock protein, KaiC [Fimbriimonas ginsengisoli Gsoil 348]|uniref:Putative circadian clock protein, KaiC n=1 Tax=Fimbriimonas ginsengisoli Gsoil 348 TaxID=661478 RepID=A0A068NK03_FIMGI|nr:putative circadian clock protein, KaiC [Fimbriimonas ginsengisoli Gsoil 348]